MSTHAPPHPLAALRHRRVFTELLVFWEEGRRIERVAYVIGATLVGSGLFHLAVYAVDGGAWEGPVSWRKPITFGLSFGLSLISAAWAMSFIRLSRRVRAWLLGLFAYACVVEVATISLQRWRGVASHFNEETPFDAVIGKLGIALGGGILFGYVAVVAASTLLPGRLAHVTREMRLALRAGWSLFLAAMLFGVVMVVTGVSKLAAPGDGPEQQQAAYTSAGWLKPAHAITMHAILILPALAWLASQLPWTPQRRYRTIALATAGYTVVAVVIAGQTLAGHNVFTAPLWTDVLAILGATGFATAAVRVLAALSRRDSREDLARVPDGN